ncbi:MAG: RraA family protein [Pigmentiphaga sp.]|nr:RraA family protein [Pigmentiphaga sp.]
MDKQVEAFQAIDTALAADALDRLGIESGCLGIRQIVTGTRAVGRASTVRFRPVNRVNPPNNVDFLDEVPAGNIAVLDNGGREYCSVWGDIMTVHAITKGLAGTVVDGVCRDIIKMRELHYPMFSRGTFMQTGKDRIETDAINVPVTVGGRQVCPGDIIIADDTGVVVVPAAKADEVIAIAKEIEAAETAIIELLQQGRTLREAREIRGYYTLQTKR